MEIKKVGQIMGLGKGAEVSGVKGTVKVIFDRKTGTSDKGDWSIQGIVLADGKDELICSLKNREPLDPKLKGKVIWLIAHQKAGGKGISGLKMDEYNGKPQLSVTASAEIAQDDKSAAEQGAEKAPASNPPGQEPAASSPAASAPTKTHGQVVQKVIDLQLHYARRVNCLRLAADSSLRLARSFCEAHGQQFSESDFVMLIARHLCDTTFTTLFIDAQKAGMVDDMPSGDIDKLIAEAREVSGKLKDEKTAAQKAAKLKRVQELQAEAARLSAEAQ